MRKLLEANKYYYYTVLLLISLAGLSLLISSRDSLSLWINRHYTPFLDQIFLFFNSMGELKFTLITVVYLLLLKDWKWSLKALFCFLSVMVVTQFLKHVIFPGTPRPTLYFEEGLLRLIEGVKQLETESFPSGHTSASFAVSTFLALYKSGRKWNWIFAIFALIVAYGRIYMSQHFMTDVLLGMVIGVTITTLVYCYYPKSLNPI